MAHWCGVAQGCGVALGCGGAHRVRLGSGCGGALGCGGAHRLRRGLRMRRGSVGSALGFCMAAPSSNLGSAPHHSSEGPLPERTAMRKLQRNSTNVMIVYECKLVALCHQTFRN